MSSTLHPVRKLRIRRGGVEEIRQIADPVAFTLAASDYLGIPPMQIPPTFTPAAELLCDMKLEAWNRIKALPLMKTDGRPRRRSRAGAVRASGR